MNATFPVDTTASPSMVLVIESDPDTRAMYELAFGHEGLRTTSASTCDEGLAAARELGPSVIVTDVGPPGRATVFRMMRELRKDEQTRHIPVIAVTGYELTRGPESTRFERVLLKPVEPGALVASVRDALQRSAALKERSERLRARIPDIIERSRRALRRSRRLASAHSARRR